MEYSKPEIVFVKPAEYEGHKVILLWTPFFGNSKWFWGAMGNQSFIENKCPESRCVFTTKQEEVGISDMILFHIRDMSDSSVLPSYRNPNQSWVFSILESPIHNYLDFSLPRYQNTFNRTYTYRQDSDVTLAYGYTRENQEYAQNRRNIKGEIPKIALNRTKNVLWYVSNCNAGERLKYAEELKKYVDIDIYGNCGEKDPCMYKNNCTEQLIRSYKFYLAFENSRCKEYITEKFWSKLKSGVVPIALGAPIADYTNLAPPNSFIHVDNFTSPKELAEYIKYLDSNDDAYYRYHMWRHKYIIDLPYFSHSACRLCDLVHNDLSHRTYNVDIYWGKKENCKQ